MKVRPYIEAFKSLPSDIAQAEAHLEEQAQKSVTVQSGRVVSTQFFRRSALYVRATAERTGVTYTENLAEDPLAVMRRAVENGRIITSGEEATLTPPGLAYADLPRGPLEIPSFEEVTRAAATLEQKVLSACGDARLASCRLTYTRYADEVANSLGLAVDGACGYYTLDCHLVGEVDGSKGEQKLTWLGESPDGFRLEPAVQHGAATARLLAAPSPVPPGRQNVIINRDAACDFLFMLWRSMSAAQNRQSGSAFAGREGRSTGTTCVSLVSSGSHPGCPIRYRFDNEGTPVTATRLMDRGVFRSLMHNRTTAQAAGVASTGNAGRRITMSGVIQVPLLVTPKVLYVEAGEQDRDELLRLLGDGLVIEEILDMFHGIDYASGEFSVPVTCTIIRGGEARAGTGALVWAGNLADVLGRTAAVGRDMHFSCFRDSYTLGASDLLVQDQRFAGAGA